MATTSEVAPFKFFEDYEVNPKTHQKRARALRYDLNALADFEQQVGMGFAQLMQMKAGFATVRAIAWAGLKWQDRGLTIERCGELVGHAVKNGASIDEILTVCIEAAVEQGALGRPREATESKELAAAADADIDAGKENESTTVLS